MQFLLTSTDGKSLLKLLNNLCLALTTIQAGLGYLEEFFNDNNQAKTPALRNSAQQVSEQISRQVEQKDSPLVLQSGPPASSVTPVHSPEASTLQGLEEEWGRLTDSVMRDLRHRLLTDSNRLQACKEAVTETLSNLQTAIISRKKWLGNHLLCNKDKLSFLAKCTSAEIATSMIVTAKLLSTLTSELKIDSNDLPAGRANQ